jgi:hypothetical protein
MVRQVLPSTTLPEHKRTERERPALGPLIGIIDAMLRAAASVVLIRDN